MLAAFNIFLRCQNFFHFFKLKVHLGLTKRWDYIYNQKVLNFDVLTEGSVVCQICMYDLFETDPKSGTCFHKVLVSEIIYTFDSIIAVSKRNVH